MIQAAAAAAAVAVEPEMISIKEGSVKKFKETILIGIILSALSSCSNTAASEYTYKGRTYVVIDYSGETGYFDTRNTHAEKRVITRNSSGKWVPAGTPHDVITSKGKFQRNLDSSKIKTIRSDEQHPEYYDQNKQPVIKILNSELNKTSAEDETRGD